ncbi:cyclic AMP-responsive element-binding protein 1 isoform X2 [Schistocerca americana]|uniref:cyclic AMP-responsive element-binding protein 1 isoform X2 n=1 Tax=Schistocerca americana TaxID=7009 RepID=UPI001F503C27|nr:cyclic AMP-responsive element-binding protein 1 isoform X2 [Schistocerca americana]XP_047110673.1 cyclic AMP-responsive element-binding protein 1 isoform X2 [Schistocerca piceifrons]XP_049780088.1 cyclic AMP-responsive element-binding protein 1 isoform X2 [Schistocerca cancellata]XP_049810868.1 cyclic AMP-responsive element-binding protein 1-like isoform X4 [Schistocerca nitens]XP_049860918.1 cyclic AMP-responsive element-binding protein 1 isoform X2 [Schistocerca gregaria]XP_049860919.1 cy
MDGMVDENGTGATDPLAHSPGDTSSQVVVTSVQSVIQPNQQSVIQTPSSIHPVQLQKGNVILVSKPNSVIQTTQGSLQTLQVVETASDDSLSNDDEASKKRRDILTRRPSYRKILNDLGGGEIAVIPGTIQIGSQGETVQGLHTLTMTNASTGGAIVQYATQGQDGQFFVPVVTQGGGLGSGPIIAEDQARKREMRLLKNREAARECRRKKKEYIKCLENRVAVLENQNKALIDELKQLKDLYCQQKTE